ncbi:hypothetical protein CAPTEDRAFT_185813 [Capitella teleta]|uniref:CARD domain-containing protein n=1 Tax=Capitella teleta TaxID=283909 RepID=R7UKC7_CAPTE|nr:hypothetical protein CAPTEDRAFT_185813 [Capitella teleta]|eukprot:ELU06538.1 hypothetical protein CAPTEDRAFT_185813 [Capitella teleta]
MSSRSNSFKGSFLFRTLMGNTNSPKFRRRSEPPGNKSDTSTWEMIDREDVPPVRIQPPSHRNSESSFSSWQEYSAGDDEDYDTDVAIKVQEVRKSVEQSLTFGPLSKQLLLNQLNGVERLACVLKKAEQSSKSRLSINNQERLDRNRESLCLNMTMDDNFYKHLQAKKVISADLAEEIRSVGTKRRQVATLLDLVKLLGEKAFCGFCSALEASGQGFLVDTINLMDMDRETQDSMSRSCPSFDRLLSEKTEHVVLPVACFPLSSHSIMMDVSVREGGTPLLDEHGKPQSRMCSVYTMALIKNRVRLCRELFAEMIFDFLLEDEILTTDVTEALFLLGTRHRMNQVLMNILPFYGDAAFESFVSALKRTGQDHLALLLENFVISNHPTVNNQSNNPP